MCMISLHICHQVVKNIQETKVMLSYAYGGKLSITNCGQNNKTILYRFLLCFSLTHGWGLTITGFSVKN